MKRRTAALLWMVVSAAVSLHVAQAQKWQPMVFRADAPGIDENPLRGLVPYSNTRQERESTFPHSLEWFYMPLSDVVTGPESYDWSAFDRQLSAIAGRGHQAVFRFYVDYPKKPGGIPRYLLDGGLKTFPYDDAGNAMSPTPSVAPDYRDPSLIDCMVRFIHALAARYDGDVRIAFVEAGLYGFWGEWHVHQHPMLGEPRGWAIAQKDKDALLRAYIEGFQHTLVLVRYPKVTDDRRLLAHFGFHDDSFLQDTLGPERWQFMPLMEQFDTMDMWLWRPIGGEIRPELQAKLWDKWPNAEGQDVKAAIAATHATWMLDSDLFKMPPTPDQRTNALHAERMMGYTLFCAATRMTRRPDGSTELTVRAENRGVAPIYYAWPVDLQALDAKGKVVAQTRVEWPLSSLLPGKKAEWSTALSATPEQIKVVLLHIANPMPGGHPIAFANQEMGTVREGWLTLNMASDQ